jgi:hypothetical protein
VPYLCKPPASGRPKQQGLTHHDAPSRPTQLQIRLPDHVSQQAQIPTVVPAGRAQSFGTFNSTTWYVQQRLSSERKQRAPSPSRARRTCTVGVMGLAHSFHCIKNLKPTINARESMLNSVPGIEEDLNRLKRWISCTPLEKPVRGGR